MGIIECQTWEEFEANLSTIFQEQNQRDSTFSTPLFRGQESAEWKLETTLERFGLQNFQMAKYYHVMRRIEPSVVSLTEKSWELPNNYEQDDSKSRPPLGYEFMVYLRHHGFPSPLLDWSRSPYVAAFFAFRSKQATLDEKVAIYCFIEYCGKGKSISPKEAFLVGLGPYIKTHKRHFVQQCEYTICKKHVAENSLYCPHEDAFQGASKGQDQLTKFILPRSERTKVLEKLHVMNVNSYSLFGNEEGLMETLAYQEFEKNLSLLI